MSPSFGNFDSEWKTEEAALEHAKINLEWLDCKICRKKYEKDDDAIDKAIIKKKLNIPL